MQWQRWRQAEVGDEHRERERSRADSIRQGWQQETRPLRWTPTWNSQLPWPLVHILSTAASLCFHFYFLVFILVLATQSSVNFLTLWKWYNDIICLCERFTVPLLSQVVLYLWQPCCSLSNLLCSVILDIADLGKPFPQLRFYSLP